MKAILVKKVGLVIWGLLVMLSATASEPEIGVAGAKKITLKLDKVSENTQLVIKDFDGITIYSEIIDKTDDAYFKMFDFSPLHDGIYLVEFENSKKIISYLVSIINDKISSFAFVKYEAYKPTAVQKGNKVFVSKFNPENTYLKITIYDESDEVVYKETLTGKNKLGKIFDFSKVSGEYRIAMCFDNRTYYHIISTD